MRPMLQPFLRIAERAAFRFTRWFVAVFAIAMLAAVAPSYIVYRLLAAPAWDDMGFLRNLIIEVVIDALALLLIIVLGTLGMKLYSWSYLQLNREAAIRHDGSGEAHSARRLHDSDTHVR